VIKSSDSDATIDNRRVVYSLIGRDSKFFFINPRTGRIMVSSRGEGQIDREKNDRFKFQV
jgi:hypothetical protein